MMTVEIDPVFAGAKWGAGKAVTMNAHAEVAMTERIYTIGLGGCHCTVAGHGDKIQLAHYCPLSIHRHIDVLRSFRPDWVSLWVPGEWVKRGEFWKMEPQSEPKELAALCQEVHGYGEARDFDDDGMVDYNAGRIFAFGCPVPS